MFFFTPTIQFLLPLLSTFLSLFYRGNLSIFSPCVLFFYESASPCSRFTFRCAWHYAFSSVQSTLLAFFLHPNCGLKFRLQVYRTFWHFFLLKAYHKTIAKIAWQTTRKTKLMCDILCHTLSIWVYLTAVIGRSLPRKSRVVYPSSYLCGWNVSCCSSHCTRCVNRHTHIAY